MRSPREISFRLKQELRNLQLFAFPPNARKASPSRLPRLPDPHAVAGKLADTAFSATVLEAADQILAHRFPLLGCTIDTGPQIDWRRDYFRQISTNTQYFRRIPYLDATRAGDHKFIWELNRHQHLVLLAQAFLFSNRAAYLDELITQLNSWRQQNPYQRGINWASALEVAFRAFSWMWLYHFIGVNFDPDSHARLLESLYQHGRHIENNLSFYFSPNTHLLGEAVVLHALGCLFPSFPRAQQWTQLGNQTVLEQMSRQVQRDGSHFEQSTYYHVYALDMFLFHAMMSSPSHEYMETLARMADFLYAIVGPERLLPFLGDDDGGRWFHPYGKREEFARATLATCSVLLNRSDWIFQREDLYPQAAWWLGQTEGSARALHHSRIFANSGVAVLESSSGRVVIDAGGFGPGRAGHSHSDSLSLLATARNQPILVDSGTYTYVGDPELRNAFRGSAAHNTLRIDGRDQAIAVGPFRWTDVPDVEIVRSQFSDDQDELCAECRYAGFIHRRLLRFLKPRLVVILDSVDGPDGQHKVEQFWHLASPRAQSHLFFGSKPQEFDCWHSPVFGKKEPARCLVLSRHVVLPAYFAAAIVMDANLQVTVAETDDRASFACDGQKFELAWPNLS